MVKIGSGEELAKVLHYYGLLEGDSEFKIVCPFHQDVNPSMKISLSDGTFYCFGCGVSGNAMRFVELANSDLDKLEACREYYRILRSKKVKHLNVEIRHKNKIADKQALVEAEDYYFGLKTVDWRTEECAEKEYMRKRGFNSKSLNLCKAKINYSNKFYPLIFPMFDLNEFKGWVCRTTDKRVEAKRKYLYNVGFSRRDTLVGSYSSKVVILVEGYMDWLKMRQNGVKNVAAILGWKITAQQISKLKKQGVKIIISALDNDTCGMKGSEYLKSFFKVVRFQFPEGVKDPGEMDFETFSRAYERTKKEFRRVLNNGAYRRY